MSTTVVPSVSTLNYTSDPSLVLNNHSNITLQPSAVVGAGAGAGAVAAIALPSVVAINATTVNDTLNSAASAAFSDPPPEPIDYSPVTQLTVGEWVVVATIFLMLVLVTAVILWQVCVGQRRRRVVKTAVLRQLHNDHDDDDRGKDEGKMRGAGWEVFSGDGDVKGLVADGNGVGGRGGVERYAYRLSHAVEMIRQK